MSSCYQIYCGLVPDNEKSSLLPAGLSFAMPSKKALPKKNILNSETKTVKSDFEEISKMALHLSHKTHEIKKDFQRTLSGLEKFINNEHSQNAMTLEELVQMIIRSCNNYSQSRGQQIKFNQNVDLSLYTEQVYALTSILTNLAVNAVESISTNGVIEIRVYESEKQVCLEVADNGPGIPKKKLPRIFDLGYTTKFNADGKPFTGIGLNHVSELTRKLGGSVETFPTSNIDGSGIGATFRVKIPIEEIAMEGDNKNGPLHLLYN